MHLPNTSGKHFNMCKIIKGSQISAANGIYYDEVTDILL